MRFVLASKSPRRKEILEKIDLHFDVVVSDADESVPEGIGGKAAVEEISKRKGISVLESLEDKDDTLVISADTVVCIDGKILGKPKDKDDAYKMLSALSGCEHEVYTGFTLAAKDKIYTSSVCTKVYFKALSDEEIWRYIESGEPMDKAGAYGIQEKGAVFVESIVGDYFNVMGLPICEICKCAKEEFNIDLIH